MFPQTPGIAVDMSVFLISKVATCSRRNMHSNGSTSYRRCASAHLGRGLPQECANNKSTYKLSICQCSRFKQVARRNVRSNGSTNKFSMCQRSDFGKVSRRDVRSNGLTKTLSMCQRSSFWKRSPATDRQTSCQCASAPGFGKVSHKILPQERAQQQINRPLLHT